MPIKFKRVGPYKRPSRAKPKKTKTCPVCASTFKASRSDQVFCSAKCRHQNHVGIPEDVTQAADEVRAKRTERSRKAKEKRDAQKARKAEFEAGRTEREVQSFMSVWQKVINIQTTEEDKARIAQERDAAFEERFGVKL